MLHKRRTGPDRVADAAGALVVAARDWLLASDPGLVRLTLAVRGTLSVFLTSVAALLVAGITHASPVEFASGITLSMMGPFLTREPTLRQRQWSLLVLVLPAAVATAATSLLHGQGPIGDSAFLALVFISFLLHPRDPRVIGLGLVAVVTTYVGLYLELPPATIPMQLLGLVMAVPLIAFACFVAVPVNPAATLRRAVRAVQWRAARVLHTAIDVAADGRAPDALVARLRRDLAWLNEAALAADDQLELLQPIGREAVRAGLIGLELAASRLIDALRREKPGPRHAIRLLLHERRMRRGDPYAMTATMLKPGTLRASLVALGTAAHQLGEAAATMRTAAEAPAASGLPPGPLGWRLATRVTLAAALAMAGGMALSPQRWFWAVLTVYVVFLNTRSRGDTIYKGLQRLGGTLLGIAGGLAIAELLGGYERLQVAVLLLSVFGMYYWFLISYTAGILCVTVMLGLLYGMLGASMESLLVLRLEETAIGAAAAVFVASFVLPTRTRDQVMRSGRGVLAALLDAVRSCRGALAGQPGVSPMVAMRRVDRQVADLRLALAPLTARRSLFRRSALERPVPALIECVHWTRVLAAASVDRPGDGDAAALAARAAQIEARLAALAGTAPDTAPPAGAPPAGAGSGDGHRPPTEIGDALEKLDGAVALLAERLEIGVLEGFALGA